MNPFWSKLNFSAKVAPNRKPCSCRPFVERLEVRSVPSISAIELRLHGSLPGNQRNSASATGPIGQSVVAFSSLSTDGKKADIFAQRISPTGTKVGGLIHVSTSSAFDTETDVAMDDTGAFVIAWTAILPGGNRNVQMSRFNALGVRQGTIVNVAGTSAVESMPSLAVSAGGEFVISYTRATTSTKSDVIARRYSSAGLLLQTIYVANAPSVREDSSAVARSKGPAASFAIAYRAGYDIYVRRYSPAGVLEKVSIVANTPRSEAYPAIDMDKAGNAILAWQDFNGVDWDVRARRYDKAGNLLPVFAVGIRKGNSTGLEVDPVYEQHPVVALHPTNGKAVIAYELWTVDQDSIADPTTSRSKATVHIVEFSKTNTVLVTKTTAAYDDDEDDVFQQLRAVYPAISLGGNGAYLVHFTRNPGKYTDVQQGDDGESIFGHLGKL